MNNDLIVKILKGVVSQAPKVNQETVDNVKAVITYMEEGGEGAPANTVKDEPSVSFGQDEEAVQPIQAEWEAKGEPEVTKPPIKRRKRGKNKKK